MSQHNYILPEMECFSDCQAIFVGFFLPKTHTKNPTVRSLIDSDIDYGLTPQEKQLSYLLEHLSRRRGRKIGKI